MADDCFDSDSSVVEEIISQAMDLHVLEQISSINLSGVTTTDLPIDLETRFRKLKSFPQTNLKSHNTPLSTQLNSQIKDLPTTSIPISSPNWEDDDEEEEVFKPTPKPKNVDGNGGAGRYLSSSSSDEEEKDSSLTPSPRQTPLCFFCSPSSKKVSKTKKKKKKKDMSRRVDDFDSFGSDLIKFSLKEHKRSLKKALKEQDKIAREAEQVVNLAKQLSARIEDFVIHDDNNKFK
ncbi:hypothetical protein AQUCO_02100025v1 [Aquilegia coerulea]|uniref:Uncharacterized protein n=1 Tax=Aquilegia coerulea TaxID=218851 RepID=A0A2G5DEF0_AQUCA|nr:hypothetical protein AQUCO_02100025v1 [Aquilegia coerulea]